MNDEIKIIPAEEKYYNDIVEMFSVAFGSKFGYISDDEKLQHDCINYFFKIVFDIGDRLD